MSTSLSCLFGNDTPLSTPWLSGFRQSPLAGSWKVPLSALLIRQTHDLIKLNQAISVYPKPQSSLVLHESHCKRKSYRVGGRLPIMDSEQSTGIHQIHAEAALFHQLLACKHQCTSCAKALFHLQRNLHSTLCLPHQSTSFRCLPAPVHSQERMCICLN